MINLTQKHQLSCSHFFIEAVKMALIGVATDITHERPSELTFGSQQTAVEEAGIVVQAQADMHKKRRAYALQVLQRPDALAQQAAAATASRLLEETADKQPSIAPLLEAYLLSLINVDPLITYHEETAPTAPPLETYEAIFYGSIEAVVFGGFSAMSGYNVHTDPFIHV